MTMKEIKQFKHLFIIKIESFLKVKKTNHLFMEYFWKGFFMDKSIQMWLAAMRIVEFFSLNTPFDAALLVKTQ